MEQVQEKQQLNHHDVLYAERGSKAYRQITLAMFIAGLSTFAQLYLFQPLLPVLANYFNITPAHSSLVISAATLALAAGLLIGTFTADKFQRKGLMTTALLISSIFTIISAFVPSFTLLVILCALKGFALSGVAAIAMAYVGEEVSPNALGRSMGLYIIGTIIGGMSGRVAATFLVAWFPWQTVTLIIGFSCFVLTLLFIKVLPPSKHFAPRKLTASALFSGIATAIKDWVLVALCLFAAFSMGSFVSVYNYLGFRLLAPPFKLPHQLIAGIFMMYIVGIGGSFAAGPLTDRIGYKQVLLLMAILTLAGIWLTLPNQLLLIVLGLGLLTFAFFGGHTIASSLAGRRTPQNRAVAASLYLLFYYLGSTILGTYSGVIMHRFDWTGIVILLSCTLGLALILAIAINRSDAAT